MPAAVVDTPRSAQTSGEGVASHHLGKRLRSGSAEEASTKVGQLPQDLIDLIVDCAADEADMFVLLQLRAVCGAWGKAVSSAFRGPRFGRWIQGDVIELDHDEPDSETYFESRKDRMVRREQFVLFRDCKRLRLLFNVADEVKTFERLLTPITCSGGEASRGPPPRWTLRPVAPFVTWLALVDYDEAINNEVIRRLAALLPAVRTLRVGGCDGVTDVNAFARHGITDLDISDDCGVDTRGMSQLLYVRNLRMAHREPVMLDNIAGHLTELDLSHSCAAVGIKAGQSAGAVPALVSSPDFVMQRLTKLDLSYTQFKCRDILRITPALTDLSLDTAMCSSDRNFTVPPGVPLRRLNLRSSNLQVQLGHCGDTLTELNASGADIGNDALEGLRALRKLTVGDNRRITRLAPVADTLTELDAFGKTGITDASLASLRRLRTLSVWRVPNVSTIAPFAETLTELHVDHCPGFAGADLGIAPNLTHLSATGDGCGIGDANLKSCTTLTRLHCSENNRITTIRPFIETLEELYGNGLIPRDEIAAAPRLKVDR